MSTLDPEVTALVFRLAGPALAAELARRLGCGAEATPAEGTAEPSASPGIPPVVLPGPREASSAGAPPEDPVARARRPGLPEAEIAELLGLDDPAVDAALFAHQRLGRAERARLLAGVRRDGTRGPVPGPLLEVLWEAELGRCAGWLASGMTSGDLGVAEVITGRLTLRTDAGRLRLITAVWERHGPEEAWRIVAEASFPPALAAVIEAARAGSDGLVRLRALLAAEEEPGRIVASLRSVTEEHADHVGRIVAEGGELPWAARPAPHRAAALPYALHVALAERPDCPREMLVALLDAGLPDPYGRKPPWLAGALSRGALAPADLFAYARPAVRALPPLMGDGEAAMPGAADEAGVRARFAGRLGEDVEAWTVAARLLPEFAGTLPELLTTATAVVASGPRSG